MRYDTELREALAVYRRQDEMSPAEALESAEILSRRGFWSIRQLAAITGVSVSRVSRHVKAKKDRSGGRFNPRSLSHMVESIDLSNRGRPGDYELWKAVALGSSTYVVAKLTGIPVSTVKTRVKKFGSDAQSRQGGSA